MKWPYARYAPPGEIGANADIISLHCPLTPETHHIVNADALSGAKRGALLINTGQGGLVDTEAVIEALSQPFIYVPTCIGADAQLSQSPAAR